MAMDHVPGRGPARLRRESLAARHARTIEILKRLRTIYPDAHCELDFANPYQLLAATILSAQCTDVRVNQVTPALFKKWPTPARLATAPIPALEAVIRSTGFFRNKAKNLVGMAQAVVAEHDGAIPDTMDELRALPGVGRKTANVILGNAFGRNEGITVDTHVLRLSRLLRLARGTEAEKVEAELIPLVPRDDWTLASHLLIWHGRRICIANRPRCEECVLSELCPSAFMLSPKPARARVGR